MSTDTDPIGSAAADAVAAPLDLLLTEPDHGSDSVALETSARPGTFEGTETMQTLIVGRAITGIGAFTY